jgi:hypothetical protein
MTLVIATDSYAVDGYTMRRYRVMLLGIFYIHFPLTGNAKSLVFLSVMIIETIIAFLAAKT